MTGSRAGVVLAGLGLVSACWVYRSPVAKERSAERGAERRTRFIGIGLISLLMVFAGIVAARTPAVLRLLETDPAGELRVITLPIVTKAAGEFFPFGSGLGTFVETYQIFEPNRLVSGTYFNHAHNDFLELLLTAGLPGLALVVWALVLGLWSARSQLKLRGLAPDQPGFQSQVLGRAGLAILVMLALNSAADYPLRVPSLMLLAAVAAGWCSNAYRAAQR
jgi:O-antigen ligase